MGITLSEGIWRIYVAPKGRVGNWAQGALLRVAETSRIKKKLSGASKLLLVHSPGKVGSSAIYHALMDSSISEDAVVVQTHTIRDKRDSRELQERNGLAPRRTDFTSDFLYSEIVANGLADKEVTVISAVRDPVDRAVSDFFQNLDRYTPDRRYPRPGQYTVADYLSFFENGVNIFRHTDWFEEQFCGLFGLDLYGDEFDSGAGYQIVSRDNIKGGVIRYDRLTDSAAKFTNDLLGVDLRLRRNNDSANKAYSNVYPEFKKALALDHKTLEELYGLRHVKHFFLPSERHEAIRKWRKE